MTGSRMFIDTSPFIYVLEDNDRYSATVRRFLSDCYVSGIQFFTSLLTFTEYCVVPYRQNDERKIKDFENFLVDAEISIVQLTERIAKYASWLRAKYHGIKAMDSLQLASAIQAGCDVFFTNDKQLLQVDEIRCVLADGL